MTLSLSRVLSLIVVAVAYVRAWSIPSGLWLVTLVCAPVLLVPCASLWEVIKLIG